MDHLYEQFDLIEEITRNDGSQYYEISNIDQNGFAELAANNGLIKSVRILVINIPVFKDSLMTITEAASELDYARVMSPQCLERLSTYLTKIR